MDGSIIALSLSIFSIVIATFSLGWNVYRDVVLKPRVNVTFGVKKVYQEGRPPSPDYIGMTIVNHGPGNIVVNSLVLKETSLLKKIFRKEKFAILNHDWNNQYSGKFPVKLEVGDGVDLFVNFDEKCFLAHQFTDLGVNDSFGRTSWAKKSAVTRNRRLWIEKFSKNK